MTNSPLDPDGPSIADLGLGLPGAAEPLPVGDHLEDEPTRVNDDDSAGGA